MGKKNSKSIEITVKKRTNHHNQCGKLTKWPLKQAQSHIFIFTMTTEWSFDMDNVKSQGYPG